ncbi:MAG: CDP-alcohol phosphatidyltransferase family protein, partial [Acidobacteriota bacterium]
MSRPFPFRIAAFRHVPNALSLARILLVPMLVVVLLTKFDGKEFVGLGLFLLAALTDFLDGYIARRWGIETRLGKILDPAADKILTSAAPGTGSAHRCSGLFRSVCSRR